MKKLLLALITVSITPSLFAQIALIEQKNLYIDTRSPAVNTNVVVICINNYVFIQTKYRDRVSMTQMMAESNTSSRNDSNVPYKCKDYIKDMNK